MKGQQRTTAKKGKSGQQREKAADLGTPVPSFLVTVLSAVLRCFLFFEAVVIVQIEWPTGLFQPRRQFRHQRPRRHRLHEHVQASRVQAALPCGRIIMPRQRDELATSRRTQEMYRRQAVAVRQRQIQQDELRRVCGAESNGVRNRPRRCKAIPRGLDENAHGARHRLVVFDEKDVRGRHGGIGLSRRRKPARSAR